MNEKTEINENTENNENIEEPLTKPKIIKSKIIETTKTLSENIKPKRKSNVPQTEKQKANFEKARLKRAENVAKRKEAKELEMAKKYMESNKKIEPEIESETEIIYKIKKKPKKKIVYIQESDDSEEEEIIQPKRRVNRQEKKQEKEEEEIYFTMFFR